MRYTHSATCITHLHHKKHASHFTNSHSQDQAHKNDERPKLSFVFYSLALTFAFNHKLTLYSLNIHLDIYSIIDFLSYSPAH